MCQHQGASGSKGDFALGVSFIERLGFPEELWSFTLAGELVLGIEHCTSVKGEAAATYAPGEVVAKLL